MTRSIAVIDAETDPFRRGRFPAPFLWGYFDGERYIEFSDAKTLAAHLRRQDRIIYAHNGGRFDFYFLLNELDPYSELIIINGRIASCRIGNAELRDSVCIVPIALEQFKKTEIDYELFEPRRRRWHMAEIREYLRDDCINLHELVSAFVARFGTKLTVASAAMSEWQRVASEQGLPDVPRTDARFYERFAPYYYGGRVECFESGIIDAEFDVIDINSAYPFAMGHQHPYGDQFEEIDGYAPGADFYRLTGDGGGALPWRGLGDEHGYGLRFPNDGEVREYFVTGWEYAAAIETAALRRKKVISSIRFAERQTFAPYVAYWWRERERAKADKDDLGSIFAKLMLNSLYGKFAANPDNYAQFMNVPATRKNERLLLAGGKWKHGGELGKWLLAQAELPDARRRYYNVATGASITGFVRAMLWRAIAASGGVLYCDTDSIAARRIGRGVTLSSALGDWKHEGSFDRAGIAGKKLYIFRGRDADGKRIYKKASKGVRLSNSELWRVAAGGAVTYTGIVPTYSVKRDPVFITRDIRKTA